MKTIFRGLLVVLGLTTTLVNADFLGDADDTYVGFQMTASLDSISRGLISDRNRYSYLLIKQRDGIKDGITLTRDRDGNQTLNYLIPSTTLDVSKNKIAEYSVPVMRLQSEDGSGTGDSDTGKSANYATVGTTLLAIGVMLKLKQDLEKDWKPAD